MIMFFFTQKWCNHLVKFRVLYQVGSRGGSLLLSQVLVFFQEELCPPVIHPRATLICPETRKEN